MKKKIEMEAASKLKSSDLPKSTVEEVGYKKPPKHSQFKMGQSGNPSGKPKKTKTLDEIVIAFMDKPKTVFNDGKKAKFTPSELVPEIYFKQFTQGKTKSGDALLKLHGEAIERLTKESRAKPEPFSWSDQSEKLTKFLERAVWGADKLDPDPNPTSSASESLDDEVDHPLPTKSNKIGKQ